MEAREPMTHGGREVERVGRRQGLDNTLRCLSEVVEDDTKMTEV